MLRVAIVNLNKRMNSRAPRDRLVRWLGQERVGVLVGIEPWLAPSGDNAFIGELCSTGGTSKVHVWAHRAFVPPQTRIVEDFWVRIQLGYLAMHGVYLDAYKQAARASQLMRLAEGLTLEACRPILVAGDFNIAPEPLDGLLDGMPSAFNSKTDRQPLTRLRSSLELCDLTAREPAREWTIERTIRGRLSQFRCDLAFVSDYIEPDVEVRYDHTVRVGDTAFTDHSAIVLGLPITLEKTRAQTELFGPVELAEQDAQTPEVASEKTAMRRRDPSSIASRVVRAIIEQRRYRSVLDYGCGYGEDIEFYRSLGVLADGFDPHPGFGRSSEPNGRYDVVTLVFVLNVLPDPWERLNVVRRAAEHVARGGVLVIAARTPDEIHKQAENGDWQEFNDGYWSHEGRRTFQKGIASNEIVRLCRRLGLRRADSMEQTLDLPSNVTCVVLEADQTEAAPQNSRR